MKYPEYLLAVTFHPHPLPTSPPPQAHTNPAASKMDISLLISLVSCKTEVRLCGPEVAKAYLRELDLGHMNSDTLQEPRFSRTLTIRVPSSGTNLILWLIQTVQEKDLIMLS